jgi:predicted AlkP superfamily phosphohydrolase/phosphomutase
LRFTADLPGFRAVSAKVLIIGFDAVEATLVDRWADEGLLPTFASLRERAAQVEMDNDVERMPDTIWIEIGTGRRASKLGWYWRPEQAHAGEAEIRANEPEDFDLTAFWTLASDAGKRVAVLDAPAAAPAELNGVLIRDWGIHSPGFGIGSWPPELLDELRARHGDYPLPHSWEPDGPKPIGCDAPEGSREALLDFPSVLAEAIDRKTAAITDLLDREEWDLFVAAFAEGHCAGHQLWHFLDESSPWHDPDAPETLRNGMRDTYVRLDAALARVLEHAGEDTTVMVVLSHGMGPSQGGFQLLPELMVRLGYSSAPAAARSIRARLPRPVRQAIKAVVPARLKDPLKDKLGTSSHPFALTQTKAACVRCGVNGAIRVNLKGRDPNGSVEPGAEYDAICDDLVQALGELRDKETGKPVVEEAFRTDRAYGADGHPNLPDVIIRFRRDLPVWSVTSDRVGTVSEPPRNREFPRSGDHTANSRAWLFGPRVENAGTQRANLLDIAPTALELLGVPVPETLDGTVLPLVRPSLV